MNRAARAYRAARLKDANQEEELCHAFRFADDFRAGGAFAGDGPDISKLVLTSEQLMKTNRVYKIYYDKCCDRPDCTNHGWVVDFYTRTPMGMGTVECFTESHGPYRTLQDVLNHLEKEEC